MNALSTGQPVLSIPYLRFFAGRLRMWVSRKLELGAGQRRIRLFTLDNDVIGRRIRTQGAYEPEVLAAIDAVAAGAGRSAGVALDIGANIGNHAVSMARSFSRVVAFEPHPVMAAALRANALLNGCSNLQVMEMALSAHVGDGVLQQQRPDHSGTLELAADGASAMDAPGRVAVQLMRGDDVLDRVLEPGERVTLIKIDVEGAELPALQGLAACLQRDHPVICFEVRHPAEGQLVRAFLEDAGYRDFQAIRASRIGLGSLHRLLTRAGRSKHYQLEPVAEFEDRHYAAVFAFAAQSA